MKQFLRLMAWYQRIEKRDQYISQRLDQIDERLNYELDFLRSRIEVGEELLLQYLSDKAEDNYWTAYSQSEPLVTVCIPTFNRGALLTERTIPSVLQQTYKNIEVIVVGDCCTDDTAERISAIKDSRLTFINLSERGNYPKDPNRRWMVAGTTPTNHALSLAKGAFITHLDDDDRYEPNRIESLLETAIREKAEMVWHPFHMQLENGDWTQCSAEKFSHGQITTSSVFYHSWFARIAWNINAHIMQEPGDWNRMRKFDYFGAKKVRNPNYLLWHYKERTNAGK